jgi:hypothetical protein
MFLGWMGSLGRNAKAMDEIQMSPGSSRSLI